MPKLPTAVATPAKPAKANGKGKTKPAPEPVKEVRDVIYPVREARWMDTGEGGEGPITRQMMRDFLGWEDEPAYALRMVEEKPDLKAQFEALEKDEDRKTFLGQIKIPDRDVLLKDEHGDRVACWNNWSNRPFDLERAYLYAQDILNRKWAGPLNIEDATVNGEPIIIGRTARCLSIQHRGVGYELACQLWEGPQQLKWAALWPEEPVFESLVVLGVSEDDRVVRTIDGGKPRTEADVFATLELFEDTDPTERKLLSLMLNKAVDFVWDRTWASYNDEGKWSDSHGYRTNSEAVEFLERHRDHLIQSVTWMHQQNKWNEEEEKSRYISKLKLSPGQMAGVFYLMGAAETDESDYYFPSMKKGATEPPVPRKEEYLDWGAWKKAQQFWAALVKGDKTLQPVRKALAHLASKDDAVLGPKTAKKLAILAKAWNAYRAGDVVTAATLKLDTKTDENKNEVLVDYPTFGGIDKGAKNTEVGTPAATPAAQATTAREQVQAVATPAKKPAKLPVSQTVAEPGSGDGTGPAKPPVPKILPVPQHKAGTEPKKPAPKPAGKPAPARQTRKTIEADQTAKAKAADAAMANGKK